jgi:hypothetical protein
MRKSRALWLLVGAVGLLGLACTGNDLDDGDTADVVLLVTQMQTGPVSGQAEVGTCSITTAVQCLDNSDCPINEACILPIAGAECTIPEWQLQLVNKPKSEKATFSPFSDIELRSIDTVYTDPISGALLFTRSFPISGLVNANNGTASVAFEPITFNDLTVDNTTLNLSAVVRGQTVGGDGVEAIFGAQLFIEDCIP